MADFTALHTALSGLRVASLRMDTASHNVSNANTEGYTRQKVDLHTRYPMTTVYGQIGTGVDVTDVSRVRDAFADTRYRNSLSTASSLEVRADVLRRAELATGEPGEGITSELNMLWSSFEDLALDPSDTASRIAVIDQLASLAARVTAVDQGLVALADDSATALSASVDEVNGLLEQVAELNVAIVEASAAPGSPNDLLDQRDQLVDRLAELAGVSVMPNDNGSIRVSIGGVAIVDGAAVSPLSVDAVTHEVLHSSGVALSPGGRVGGYQSVLLGELPDLDAQLDTFASELADAVNAVHAAGYTAGGVPGGPLLSYNPSDPAGTLTVAVSDPAELATAGTPGPPYPEFDASMPEAMARLRTEKVASGGTRSLAELYKTVITSLGQQTSAAARAWQTQSNLSAAASLTRDGSHGVSIDEEMVEMMEAQRMYEAAARVMTSVDEALDVLINRTGVVGR